MTVTFIGVRHHSPACARLVGETIAALRPAYVLVEGPADMNERMDELLLGHTLPIAVFSSYRDEHRHAGSWAPFCEYSPEWVALTAGRAAGAEVRFIDLPAWHEALAGRENRYRDAEERYAEAVDRLCEAFSVDNVDSLWDHLFEIEPATTTASTATAASTASTASTATAASTAGPAHHPDGTSAVGGTGSGSAIEARLAAYFDLLRGESEASEGDRAREEYMARWVRAAQREAGERPVVVVTGGFHRPALMRLTARERAAAADDAPPAPIGLAARDRAATADDAPPAPIGLAARDRAATADDAPPPPIGLAALDRAAAADAAPVGGVGVEATAEPRAAGGGDDAPVGGVGVEPKAEPRAAGGGDAAAVGSAGLQPRAQQPADEDGWPAAPSLPRGAVGGSYLVPYSFRRLDAFGGYQSGMPSPEYYQRLWESGAQAAADGLVGAVVRRLRRRRQGVSTADLIAARACAAGLALVRGHRHPGRTDILDGLAAALVHDALDEPLPWATRGRLRAGTHPVVVEMVAALSGDRVGRLHPATPLPPLVHDVAAELEREGLDTGGPVALSLTAPDGQRRSRMLHRLRVLAVPGFERRHGPATGVDPVLDEQWTVHEHEHRLPSLIEAGAYGATLESAAAARIAERVADAGGNVGELAGALFDAALCGTTRLSEQVLRDLGLGIASAQDLGELGRLLGVLLALWRHDRLLGTAGSAALGVVISASHDRLLWLAEGARGASAAADPGRIGAVVALRDVVRHAGARLGLDRAAALGAMARVAAGRDGPPDLRGGAFGFGWALGAQDDPVRAVRGAGGAVALGDWLSGLFAVAREEVLHAEGVLDLLDEILSGLGAEDFLIALPALRQAFAYFPPRERETIAEHVLARRGVAGSGRAMLRAPSVDAESLARAAVLESRVDAALARHGMLS
ncbi:DUF5682 family protein [Dactylosporangium sp. CA-052675]|uniref:DUF5682 family protein n=1 Tax=Dactylosporangium sp. CA-052675 TaxID=3239927 RepID=UPI003D8E542F